MTPIAFRGTEIHWAGTDDSTPPGCTIVVASVVGIPRTYLVKNDEIIGRVELNTPGVRAYVGGGLLGGQWLAGPFPGTDEALAAIAEATK